MDKKITHKEVSKRNRKDEHKTKEHVQSKVFYNKKFTAPLRKKRKNEYNAEEEAR